MFEEALDDQRLFLMRRKRCKRDFRGCAHRLWPLWMSAFWQERRRRKPIQKRSAPFFSFVSQ